MLLVHHQKAMVLQLLLLLAVSLLVSASSSQPKSYCKCAPSDPCWPSLSEWSSLNQTVSGRLIRAIPPASVCYKPPANFDQQACSYVASQWFNSSFHADDPISIDYPVWANNSCNPIFPNGTSVTGDPTAGSKGCTIGDYPVYVVNATEATHVQATLKWAAQKNIRLNIKNTGHNYPGRSTAFGSVSIWTHYMRGIEFHDDFQPDNCKLNSTAKQMAATLAAGERDYQVYQEMAKYNAIVVGGSNPSVGVIGWFQGGGHGPLSSTYGMGADNLLQATIVTPAGLLLTVNECHHPDLFYALRGGGGGTWGIVLSVVMKAYPTPQTSMHTLHLQATEINPNSTKRFWDLMAYIHSEMPRLKDGGMQGYYGIVGPPTTPTYTLVWGFYLYNKPNRTAEALFAPIKTHLDDNSDAFAYVTQVIPAPTFFDLYNATIGFEAVATGGQAMGSRLLSRKALTQDLDLLSQTLAEVGPKVDGSVSNDANPLIIGHMIANENNRGLDIGLNPAWRDAVTHLVVTEGWVDGSPRDVVQGVYNDITFNKTQALRQLDPDSGAYFNECDSFEPDWQWAFFGKNYERLHKIKKHYDPHGLLWCHSCVGSESWVEQEDGRLCRLQ